MYRPMAPRQLCNDRPADSTSCQGLRRHVLSPWRASAVYAPHLRQWHCSSTTPGGTACPSCSRLAKPWRAGAQRSGCSSGMCQATCSGIASAWTWIAPRTSWCAALLFRPHWLAGSGADMVLVLLKRVVSSVPKWLLSKPFARPSHRQEVSQARRAPMASDLGSWEYGSPSFSSNIHAIVINRQAACRSCGFSQTRPST